MVQRVRERVPTPENDNRLNINSTTNNNPFSLPTISSSVALTSQLTANPSIFTTSNNAVPILGTLLLSPIKETDSVNNTLSSGSLVTATSNKSILPLNFNSTNAQFGSLVMTANPNQDHLETTNSFVVLPTTQNENELIPVHTVPLAITTTTSQTSAVITELPVDQTDSIRSPPATPRLENLFVEMSGSPQKHKIERQQSVDSEVSTQNVDNNSNSSNSTLSRRPANGKKHGEVYV